MDKKEEVFLLITTFKKRMNINSFNNTTILTEQDIQNIISSLPNLSEETYLEQEGTDIFNLRELIPSLIKYLFVPVLLGVTFLLFSLNYFKKNIPQYIETTFVFPIKQASVVQIAGDFTNWEPVSLNKKNGVWEIKLNLKPGEYKYIYIIDGVPALDPQREVYEDQFGNKNSVIYI